MQLTGTGDVVNLTNDTTDILTGGRSQISRSIAMVNRHSLTAVHISNQTTGVTSGKNITGSKAVANIHNTATGIRYIGTNRANKTAAIVFSNHIHRGRTTGHFNKRNVIICIIRPHKTPGVALSGSIQCSACNMTVINRSIYCMADQCTGPHRSTAAFCPQKNRIFYRKV